MPKFTKILIIAIIVLVALNWMHCNKSSRLSSKIDVITQDTSRLRNEKNQEILKYKSLEVSHQELKKIFKDSIGRIKRDTKVITRIETVTKRDYKSNTVVTYDTIKGVDTMYVSPVYHGYVGDSYFYARVRADKDTIKVSPEFKSLIYVSFSQKESWIKRKPLEVSIQNQNPYSTTEAQTFNKKSKNPKLEKWGKVALFLGGFLVGSKIN